MHTCQQLHVQVVGMTDNLSLCRLRVLIEFLNQNPRLKRNLQKRKSLLIRRKLPLQNLHPVRLNPLEHLKNLTPQKAISQHHLRIVIRNHNLTTSCEYLNQLWRAVEQVGNMHILQEGSLRINFGCSNFSQVSFGDQETRLCRILMNTRCWSIVSDRCIAALVPQRCSSGSRNCIAVLNSFDFFIWWMLYKIYVNSCHEHNAYKIIRFSLARIDLELHIHWCGLEIIRSGSSFGPAIS